MALPLARRAREPQARRRICPRVIAHRTDARPTTSRTDRARCDLRVRARRTRFPEGESFVNDSVFANRPPRFARVNYFAPLLGPFGTRRRHLDRLPDTGRTERRTRTSGARAAAGDRDTAATRFAMPARQRPPMFRPANTNTILDRARASFVLDRRDRPRLAARYVSNDSVFIID